MMRFFLYDPDDKTIAPLTAREADRDYRETDAGQTNEPFVVIAKNQEVALEGARLWVECWGDTSQPCVPDHLSLDERIIPGKKIQTYMTLWVY